MKVAFEDSDCLAFFASDVQHPAGSQRSSLSGNVAEYLGCCGCS